MPKEPTMKRGEKSQIIEQILKEKGRNCPVEEVIRAFRIKTGETVSRPMVYNVRNSLKDVPEAVEHPISAEELRKMRKFVEEIGSLKRTKLLLTTVEELLQQLPT